MKKMPSISKLADEILKDSSVDKSVSCLMKKKTVLRQYESLVDIVLDDLMTEKDRKFYEHHFGNIAVSFFRCFHKRKVYISFTAIYDILFYVFKQKYRSKKSIVENSLDWVKKLSYHKKSVIVFPVHSFGILGLGWLPLMKKKDLDLYMTPDKSFSIFAQSNNLERSIDRIKNVIENQFKFKYKGKFCSDDIHHYSLTRNLNWLERNPFIVTELNFSRVEPYENQQYVIQHLEKYSTMLYFLATQQRHRKALVKGELASMSSKKVNNWETKDIYHYLVISKEKGKLTCNATPINVDEIKLNEIMALNIEFSPKLTVSGGRTVEKWIGILDRLYILYNEFRWKDKKRTLKEKFAAKVIDSLSFFRKSFRASSDLDRVVNLAIAFETLLFDQYSAYTGKAEVALRERVRSLYRKNENPILYSQAVANIYNQRCKIVHEGSVELNKDDISNGQSAFVRCFEKLLDDEDTLDFTYQQPIRVYFKLLGVEN